MRPAMEPQSMHATHAHQPCMVCPLIKTHLADCHCRYSTCPAMPRASLSCAVGTHSHDQSGAYPAYTAPPAHLEAAMGTSSAAGHSECHIMQDNNASSGHLFTALTPPRPALTMSARCSEVQRPCVNTNFPNPPISAITRLMYTAAGTASQVTG